MMANSGHIMTLANSIIGVGILAMPFCFQKCGIILSILLLVINNFITRISCHYLIKSSVITRRKSFEFLAFHTFGSSGKLMVELCIIGYLLGTCIAYFVVVGDLGPQIIAKIFNLNENSSKLRSWIMIIVTILCIIPLGLLKNVDSLSTVCTASIGFYFCLVFKVIGESSLHFLNSNYWIKNIEYWKPSGILQCIPIFSMALSCQIQLFEVLETLPNPSIEKMNHIVNVATMICTYVYILVGFFGYVAFSKQPFSGNILVHLSPSLASDAIKMGFVLSVAFSFPLVIFPCRASIYSLLFRKGHTDGTGYIPEFRFKIITISIILFSLFVGLLIPSIELVIGLVGSTIGIAICIMFPALCFMKVSKKDSSERSLAQFILVGGFCLMILGTYTNLIAIDEKHSGLATDDEHQIFQNNDNNNNNNIKLHRNISDNLTKSKNNKLQSSLNNYNNNQNQNEKNKSIITKFEDDKKLLNNNIINKLSKMKINDQNQNDIKILNNEINKPSNSINNDDNNENVKDNKQQQQNNYGDIQNKENQIIINNNKQNENDINNNITKNISYIEIDKDAIKKDEEITAEEESKIKKNKILNNDNNVARISDTANELEKTKKLLERKVDELKEQLAKQNVETQNLVVEKLGDIVQKVKQIEKQVYKDNNSNDDNNNNNNNDNNKIIKNATNNKNITSSVDDSLKSTNSNKNDKISSVIENQIKQKQNNIHLKNDNNNNNNINNIDKNSINLKNNNSNNIEINKIHHPLPLPLLINASIIQHHEQLSNNTDVNNFDIINVNNENFNNSNNKDQKINTIIDNNNNNMIDNKNENIKSIRRDILEVITSQNDNITPLIKSSTLSTIPIMNKKNTTSNLREKRELLNNSCTNWDVIKSDCLDDIITLSSSKDHIINNFHKKILNETKLNNNENNKNNSQIKTKTQSIGRDLKYIKENS